MQDEAGESMDPHAETPPLGLVNPRMKDSVSAGSYAPLPSAVKPDWSLTDVGKGLASQVSRVPPPNVAHAVSLETVTPTKPNPPPAPPAPTPARTSSAKPAATPAATPEAVWLDEEIAAIEAAEPRG